MQKNTSELKKMKQKDYIVYQTDKYFLDKNKETVFVLKAGKKLRGNPSNFIEISESEFSTINSENKNIRGFFNETNVFDLVHVNYEENNNINLKYLATNFSDDGVPNFELANSLVLPFSEKIKQNNNSFLESENEGTKSITDNIPEIVKKIKEEAKKMIPSNFMVKVESSKHISKMFNLSEKRKRKVVITKKSISTLQETLVAEKKFIKDQIALTTQKINEYGRNIIDFGNVRTELQKIIEQRKDYIKFIPEVEKTVEQHNFIEKFIKESEKIVTLLLDINGFISSTEQRKKMMELNREAFEDVFSNVQRIDTVLIPTMIGEYESYVLNQNFNKSSSVSNVIGQAINEVSSRNTTQMKKNITKAYENYNSPVHNIETMLKRQAEIISISMAIEEESKKSRERNQKYLESLSLINKSAVEMREFKGESSIQSHLDYIENLKNVE